MKIARSLSGSPVAHYTARLFVGSLLALALAGCVTQKGAPVAGLTDMQASISYWSNRYNSNPSDKDAAFAYGRALVANGQKVQAVAVLQRAVVASNGDKMLQGELGKALAANGQFEEAINVFQQAHTADHPDWRILSAHGAVLDQMGRPNDARQFYGQALRIAPAQHSVLSNLGLSYALTGELPLAERYLREANAARGADSRVRQNLALVLGLQGRFSEAETIARQEMDPAQAERNLTVLRSMLSQPNTWANIQKQNTGKSVPNGKSNGAMPTPAQLGRTGALPSPDMPAATAAPRALTRS